MVLDTSALVAILFDEPERDPFSRAVAADPRRLISAATLVETSIVVEAHRGEAAGRELDLLVHRIDAAVVAVNAAQAEIARVAWRRYGKGRHPADSTSATASRTPWPGTRENRCCSRAETFR